ncbi:MAG: hypothetical protein R2828_21315 [Saprospiraceae bacterium]
MQNQFFCTVIYCLFLTTVKGQDLPESLPAIKYHLTASEWQPLHISGASYLDAVEDMVRVAQTFQDEQGAIIDPHLGREHQYATPYYAFALGALIHRGRAKDLLDSGVLAMTKALSDFAAGSQQIPDQHGEFYIAALAGAMELYKDHIREEQYAQWEEKVTTPLATVWKGYDKSLNNWRTYVMKGEWIRAQKGFVDKQATIQFIEDNWKNATQFERIALDKWNLYQDWSSDPQSLAVEAVGRGNLSAIALDGYDGPSAQQLLDIVRRGGQTSMLLLSPAGQCPPNGRTDDHVFNDILYQLIFEALAEDAMQQKDTYLAGQYRRSAMLAFRSIQRWKRLDDPWRGSYSITKNHFDPADRIGYQPASQWSNYSGAMMFHLAEANLMRKTAIAEVPAPTEIGGYAIQTDDRFSTFTANAGGMQVFINLRGASVPKYDKYWTPLGAVRFSKINWDDRLGPSDGERTYAETGGNTKDIGLTFGPTWMENGRWINLADKASDYRGTVVTEFVHPLLVKFKVLYAYVTGQGGPYFQQEFMVTPDGVMTYLSSPQDIPFGLTVPLLVNDGRALETRVSDRIASTGYLGAGDTQHFIGLNEDMTVAITGAEVRSTYGDLLPVKFQSEEKKQVLFIYPKSREDVDARAVLESFALTANGFSSLLGKVDGTLYIGRHSAGGYGAFLDVNQDGQAELSFERACGFIAQLKDGKITAVETDAEVAMTWNGRTIMMKAFVPVVSK